MEAGVRLKNELKNFQKSRSFGFYAVPNPNDIFDWKCQFYHKGSFYQIKMMFSNNYPLSPPNIHFTKKIFHPNVFTDNSICLDIISAKWSPSLTIKDILNGLKQLLDHPNPLSPANTNAAHLYINNPKKYEEEVRKNRTKNFSKYCVPRFV